MKIKEHNKDLLLKFITDKNGNSLDNPTFIFGGEKANGLNEALKLLGDEYKIFGLDNHKSNLSLITIHASFEKHSSIESD